MDPKIKQIRRDRWLQIILAATNSGMTKKQWCNEHQISTKTFFHWQKVIREEEAERFQQMSLSYSGNSVPIPTNPGCTPAAQFSNPGLQQTFVDISTFRPEMLLQIGKYQMVVGNGISETTLATVLRVIGNA